MTILKPNLKACTLTIYKALGTFTSKLCVQSFASAHKISTDALSALCRSLADCAAEFQRHKLPLHALVNNVGIESPPDDRSADGFEVGYF